MNLLRLPATTQRTNRPFVFAWNAEELGNFRIDRFCDLLKDRHGRILYPTLKAADVTPVDLGVHRQNFL
jgi:hypothetical protein